MWLGMITQEAEREMATRHASVENKQEEEGRGEVCWRPREGREGNKGQWRAYTPGSSLSLVFADELKSAREE